MAKARYLLEVTKDTSGLNPFEYWGNGVSKKEIVALYNEQKAKGTNFYALWVKVGTKSKRIILNEHTIGAR